MELIWLGHACFLIDLDGVKVLTDPPGPDVGYPARQVRADIVTVSHQHGDHNNVAMALGDPRVFDAPGVYEALGVKITGIPSFHDPEKGRLRGKNTIFVIEHQNCRIVHLGDLGERLPDSTVDRLAGADILLIPVGSVYTIDADQAFELVGRIKPKITVPMHFKTPHLTFKLDPVEKFIMKFPQVEKLPSLSISTPVPDKPRVVVLDYLSS